MLFFCASVNAFFVAFDNFTVLSVPSFDEIALTNCSSEVVSVHDVRPLKSNAVTADELKNDDDNVNDVRESHPKNILTMLVTLDVSKLLKSNEVMDLQSKNILTMLVTLDVSKLLKSNEVMDSQPKNIKFMLVTLDVSKLLKSNEVRALHL